MKTVQVVLSLCLLLAVCEVSVYSVRRGRPRGPEPCCMPPVLEGKFGLVSGVHTDGNDIGIFDESSFHLDTKNQRFSCVQQIHTNSRTITIKVIMIEQADTQDTYVAMPHFKKCMKFRGHLLNNGCLAKRYKVLATRRLGGSKSSLDVTVYEQMRMPGVRDTMTVTTDTCMPVSLTTVVNTRDEKGIMTYSFYDLKEGIADDGVFNLPDYCHPEGPYTPTTSLDDLLQQGYTQHHRARRPLFTD